MQQTLKQIAPSPRGRRRRQGFPSLEEEPPGGSVPRKRSLLLQLSATPAFVSRGRDVLEQARDDLLLFSADFRFLRERPVLSGRDDATG